MELKLPFGLKEDKLVQVSDVESGLRCNCVCPACGHKLVAKKGVSVIHHFAHHKQTDCKTGLETSLHFAAKEVIEKAGYIILPNISNYIFYNRKIALSSSSKVTIDKIYLEKRYENLIPDIIIEKKNKLLFIEIFVTHAVDKQKLQNIRNSKISALEVDLTKNKRDINFNTLKEIVVDSIDYKKWLYNSKKESLHKKIISYSMKKNIIERGLARHVDDCPIPSRVWRGKPYANFTDDCLGCDKFVLPLNIYRDDIMYCIGHKSEQEINEIVQYWSHT